MKRKIQISAAALAAVLLVPALQVFPQGALEDYNRAYQSRKTFGRDKVSYRPT